ncbi:MAG: Flp pilus assembly complex ATPase component TadA [Nitrospirae bacterium]|nr:Flp pilus assembly complex ATPase component TadA [Nitrospirota bacterium]
MPPLRLGELLQKKGLAKESHIRIALAEQAITGNLIGAILVKLSFVSSKDITQTVAEQAGLSFFDISSYNIPEEVLRLVPRDLCSRLGFVPLKVEDGIITIGIGTSENMRAVDAATRITSKPPKITMVDSSAMEAALEKSYYFLENPIQEGIDKIVESVKTGELTGTKISQLTDYLVKDAIRRKCTDIHVTPTSDTVHVFYRIDGVLLQGHCLPKIVHSGIISRVKILSKLDIAEMRIPQDGSFSFNFLNMRYDMRVSTMPTIYGENLVIRILGSGGAILRLASLGFDKDDTERLRRLFLKPYGMILICGATGSCKTTTLYAALREIDLIEKNVLTVEDPVEYRLSMVKQTSVSEKAGYSFEAAGRTFMRQDPDVILLGEIRDEETATIALRASITGHLVLSTLHTNDAVSTIPRLVNFNVDRFLLSSALLCVIGQRLVRRICSGCKKEYTLKPGELESMGFTGLNDMKTTFKGEGCSDCGGTGYSGRTTIGEIFIVTQEIKELIYSGASATAMLDVAIRNGMKTMRDNGIQKAVSGITTFEEVLRVAG